MEKLKNNDNPIIYYKSVHHKIQLYYIYIFYYSPDCFIVLIPILGNV